MGVGWFLVGMFETGHELEGNAGLDGRGAQSSLDGVFQSLSCCRSGALCLY